MEPEKHLIKSEGLDGIEAMEVSLRMSELTVRSPSHGYQSPNADIANAAKLRVGEPGSDAIQQSQFYEEFHGKMMNVLGNNFVSEDSVQDSRPFSVENIYRAFYRYGVLDQQGLIDGRCGRNEEDRLQYESISPLEKRERGQAGIAPEDNEDMEPEEHILQREGLDGTEAMEASSRMSELTVQPPSHAYQSPNGDIMYAVDLRGGGPGSDAIQQMEEYYKNMRSFGCNFVSADYCQDLEQPSYDPIYNAFEYGVVNHPEQIDESFLIPGYGCINEYQYGNPRNPTHLVYSRNTSADSVIPQSSLLNITFSGLGDSTGGSYDVPQYLSTVDSTASRPPYQNGPSNSISSSERILEKQVESRASQKPSKVWRQPSENLSKELSDWDFPTHHITLDESISPLEKRERGQAGIAPEDNEDMEPEEHILQREGLDGTEAMEASSRMSELTVQPPSHAYQSPNGDRMHAVVLRGGGPGSDAIQQMKEYYENMRSFGCNFVSGDCCQDLGQPSYDPIYNASEYGVVYQPEQIDESFRIPGYGCSNEYQYGGSYDVPQYLHTVESTASRPPFQNGPSNSISSSERVLEKQFESRASQKPSKVWRQPSENLSKELSDWDFPTHHITLDGIDDPTTQPSGQRCNICNNDLAFPPIVGEYDSSLLPAVAVLPCGHVYHCECLELLTPLELSADPPCFDCADGLP